MFQSVQKKAKAVIHIGLPKCGSTTIQSWMDMNREAIETKGGWIFDTDPKQLICACIHLAINELGVDEMTAWRNFPVLQKKRGDKIREIYDDLSGRIEKKLGNFYVFVYSWERLSYKAEEFHILALDTYLSKFFENRTYVLYLKDTVDLFVSSYSQALRSQYPEINCKSFQKWLKKLTSNPAQNFKENYFERLLVWNKVVGSRLHVNLLDPDTLKNGDLIDDFSSLIGLGPFCKPTRRNVSFAAEYIEYVRYLNLKFADDLLNKSRTQIVEILTNQSLAKPKLSVSDEQAETIRNTFHEKHEIIRNIFFPDRHFLFSPKYYGEGTTPLPLTERRKDEIELEIRKKSHTIL